MTDAGPHLKDDASRANSFPWPPVLLALAIAAAIVLGAQMPLPWPGQGDQAAHIAGLLSGAAGIVLMVYAVVTLRRHETTVMPHKTSTTLVTSGPYRLLRNPIYLGEVMAMFGLGELTANLWFVIMGVVFAIAVTGLQILPEERHLEARFGDDYRDYKSRSRRWI